MPNKFVIYAYPRTGSYHLVSLLNSAPDIQCHGEVFKRGRIELSDWHRDRMPDLTPEKRDADPVLFIQTLRRLNSSQHFGFKMFQEHTRHVPHLRWVLRSDQWKKIILVRDPIEVYASLLRAERTGIWLITNGTKNIDDSRLQEPVRFTPETWDSHVAAYGHFFRRCTEVVNAITVVYGHYTELGEMQRILDFIGSEAKASDLSADTRKQYTRAVSEGFENWSEFQAYLDVVPAPKLPI